MIAEAPITSMHDQLTSRQKAFVDHYIATQNITKAGIAAGYSPRSARQTCSEMMTKPYIRAAIEERLKEIKPSYKLSPEVLRQKAARIVHDDTLRPDTQLKAIELAGKMTPGTFEAVAPTTQINFFTVLAKINAMTPAQLDAIQGMTPSAVGHIGSASDVGRIHSPSDVETLAHQPARPSPGPVIDVTQPSSNVTPNTCTSSSLSVPASVVEDNIASAGTTSSTPQATPCDRDTTTPKNVEQNQTPSHVGQCDTQCTHGGGI